MVGSYNLYDPSTEVALCKYQLSLLTTTDYPYVPSENHVIPQNSFDPKQATNKDRSLRNVKRLKVGDKLQQ